MKALDFIKDYAKEHDGAILGSYCLHILHGTEFNDIDYFTPLLNDCLDMSDKYFTEVKVKPEMKILGKTFKLKGENYSKKFDFAAYECTDFDDVPVNLIFVIQTDKWFPAQIQKLLLGFDLDILRIWCDNKDNFKTVHTTKFYEDCIKTKIIFNIIRYKEFESWHDENRINKYKQRFPDFEIIKLDGYKLL